MAAEKGKQLQIMFIFLDTQLWDFTDLDIKKRNFRAFTERILIRLLVWIFIFLIVFTKD